MMIMMMSVYLIILMTIPTRTLMIRLSMTIHSMMLWMMSMNARITYFKGNSGAWFLSCDPSIIVVMVVVLVIS